MKVVLLTKEQNPPIGEPFISHCDKLCDQSGMLDSGQQLLKEGFQYGFNLRNIYCEDLIEEIKQLRAFSLNDKAHIADLTEKCLSLEEN